MDNLLIFLIAILLLGNFAILYFLLKNKPRQDEQFNEKFINEFNTLKSSFNDSFSSMSKEVAKDMTGALSRVDEKVGVFNKQIEYAYRDFIVFT